MFGVAPTIIMLVFLVWYCWTRKSQKTAATVIPKKKKQNRVIPFNETPKAKIKSATNSEKKKSEKKPINQSHDMS